jgi:hypothetical protein
LAPTRPGSRRAESHHRKGVMPHHECPIRQPVLAPGVLVPQQSRHRSPRTSSSPREEEVGSELVGKRAPRRAATAVLCGGSSLGRGEPTRRPRLDLDLLSGEGRRRLPSTGSTSGSRREEVVSTCHASHPRPENCRPRLLRRCTTCHPWIWSGGGTGGRRGVGAGGRGGSDGRLCVGQE